MYPFYIDQYSKLFSWITWPELPRPEEFFLGSYHWCSNEDCARRITHQQNCRSWILSVIMVGYLVYYLMLEELSLFYNSRTAKGSKLTAAVDRSSFLQIFINEIFDITCRYLFEHISNKAVSNQSQIGKFIYLRELSSRRCKSSKVIGWFQIEIPGLLPPSFHLGRSSNSQSNILFYSIHIGRQVLLKFWGGKYHLL